MTSTFLQAELAGLISESKRKSEIRSAAEKSLSDLKSLSVTSESQLAGDLHRKTDFIDPFVLACRSRVVKLAAVGVVCLQRLTAGRAVPCERLSDVLDALRETASLSLEIQLKILQTLPSLLQLYAEDLKGGLLAVALEVCDTLQASKTAVVCSTAAATFQQLLTTVYERVSEEDERSANHAEESVEIGSNVFGVRPAAYDAFRIFKDLCALTDGGQPEFAQVKALSSPFLLEVISSTLTNHENVFAKHQEQVEICRSQLLPALVKLLTTKSTFAMSVRALRTIFILLRHHLEQIQQEAEVVLLSMINLLEPNASQPWKRVLCMEVFRGLISDAAMLRQLFQYYDENDERKGIVSALMGTLVRISSEDPTLIGLGRQSTMPHRQGDTNTGENVTSFEASDIGGAVGGVLSASATVTGLSLEWSTVKIPYLDQLDKSNVSDVPTTYIYSLVLNCIAAFAEGLSRFVMPFTVPRKGKTQRLKMTENEGDDVVNWDGDAEYNEDRTSATQLARTQNRLLNPLMLKNHPQIDSIRSCAKMIDVCWPPLLATCSTYFNAALDADYYHNLVRAYQKITQVSGVLELSTPRDALLTSLSKAAVPGSTSTRKVSSSARHADTTEDEDKDGLNATQTPQSPAPKQSLGFDLPRLSVRNMLCMRALLNLGIALGPTLGEDAWYIILETLQRSESLMSLSRPALTAKGSNSDEQPSEPGGIRTVFGVENAAVQTASKRMLESTSTCTDYCFKMFIMALFRLDPEQEHEIESTPLFSPTGSYNKTLQSNRHRRVTRSISAFWTGSESHNEGQKFMISKITEVSRINLHRFTSSNSFSCSWGLIVEKLLQIFGSHHATSANRLQCASTLDTIAMEVIKVLGNEENGAQIRNRCFGILSAQLIVLIGDESNFMVEAHTRMLQTLEIMLGHCGENLTNEWMTVFDLLSSAFKSIETNQTNPGEEGLVASPSPKRHPNDSTPGSPGETVHPRTRPRAHSIVQKAFTSLQLIISDFLGSVPFQCLKSLIEVMFLFVSQEDDLNISLTTTTFFWSVASVLSDTGATWMLLFSELSQLSLDIRSEVRQSAIRMMMRIFEASGPQLSDVAWNSCLMTLFSFNLRKMDVAIQRRPGEAASWQESTVQILDGIVDLTTRNIALLSESDDFAETWREYLEVCETLLKQRNLGVSTAVFASLAKLLSALTSFTTSHDNGSRTIPALQLWYAHHPADINMASSETNQDALNHHAVAFKEIFGALGPQVSKIELPKVFSALHRTILDCVHPAYTSDVKKLAPEQEVVVHILPFLLDVSHEHMGDFINFLLGIIKAPLSSAAGTGRKPSSIALSSACISILTNTITSTAGPMIELAIPDALETLATIISTKYSATPQGDPPLWRNATVGAVTIIEFTLGKAYADVPLTSSVNAVASSILNPGALETLQHQHSPDTFQLQDDEGFDVEYFKRLNTVLTPLFATSDVPIDHLKSYILTLFHPSLVAKPSFYELPKDLLGKPLDSFNTVRPGTVCEPVFAKRNDICYTALDALFGLIKRRNSKGCGILLPKTAVPYVLLRCAYSFKTFMADQPLRSLDPLPPPLRVELLTILTRCIELRSDDLAYAGLMKAEAGSDGKNHLRLLNGLLVRMEGVWRTLPRKVAGVNWQDGEEGRRIEECFGKWAGTLAEGWDMEKEVEGRSGTDDSRF